MAKNLTPVTVEKPNDGYLISSLGKILRSSHKYSVSLLVMHSVCSAQCTKTIKTETAEQECLKIPENWSENGKKWDGTEWNG